MVVSNTAARKPEDRRPRLLLPGEGRPLRRRTAPGMNPGSAESGVILWHEGPRTPLRHLFELADDSSKQIDSYIHLGRVLVARNARGEILGHLQLIPTASPSRSSSTQPHTSTEADSALLSRQRGLTQRRLRASAGTRRRRRSKQWSSAKDSSSDSKRSPARKRPRQRFFAGRCRSSRMS